MIGPLPPRALLPALAAAAAVVGTIAAIHYHRLGLTLSHYDARGHLVVARRINEGNGDIWLAAIERPRPYAGWILIEEKAEGGDLLARRARARPEFLTRCSRVCEGGGVALYRRE